MVDFPASYVSLPECTGCVLPSNSIEKIDEFCILLVKVFTDDLFNEKGVL